jgi:hypothetical protein
MQILPKSFYNQRENKQLSLFGFLFLKAKIFMLEHIKDKKYRKKLLLMFKDSKDVPERIINQCH